jgi:hypothetical protein
MKKAASRDGLKMVGNAGLEPTTFGFGGQRITFVAFCIYAINSIKIYQYYRTYFA